MINKVLIIIILFFILLISIRQYNLENFKTLEKFQEESYNSYPNNYTNQFVFNQNNNQINNNCNELYDVSECISNADCYYDYTKNSCFKNDEKKQLVYSYTHTNCEELKEKGYNVECTFNPDNDDDDDSLYINFDREIDTQKKKFKTCYGIKC